jgi:hypothetical protein
VGKVKTNIDRVRKYANTTLVRRFKRSGSLTKAAEDLGITRDSLKVLLEKRGLFEQCGLKLKSGKLVHDAGSGDVCISDWIRKNRDSYSNRETFIKECIEATNSSRKQVTNAMYKLSKGGVLFGFFSRRNLSMQTTSVDELKRKLDYAQKLRNILSDLPKGEMVADANLRELIGVPKDRWNTMTSAPEFSKYRIDTKKCGVQWGNSEDVKEIRDTLERNGII